MQIATDIELYFWVENQGKFITNNAFWSFVWVANIRTESGCCETIALLSWSKIPVLEKYRVSESFFMFHRRLFIMWFNLKKYRLRYNEIFHHLISGENVFSVNQRLRSSGPFESILDSYNTALVQSGLPLTML